MTIKERIDNFFSYLDRADKYIEEISAIDGLDMLAHDFRRSMINLRNGSTEAELRMRGASGRFERAFATRQLSLFIGIVGDVIPEVDTDKTERLHQLRGALLNASESFIA